MADKLTPQEQQLLEYASHVYKAALPVLQKAQRVREGRGIEMDVGAVLNQQRGQGLVQQRPSVMQRIRESAQYLITGVGPMNWFGPFEPLAPMADVEGPMGARGRRYDYPVGVNLNFQPRAEEAISFAMLRGLGDAYDLLRLVIETRKDQIASYDWEIHAIDESATTTSEENSAIKAVSKLFERPDRVNGWDEWLRQVIEDVLVVDGACIYPRKTRGGNPYSLDLIDPGTITRLVDVEGRPPEAPSPAYQQIIKGVPAVDYSLEELCYWMRNPRTWKRYGYSPVEQIIVTVNIAMRRQIYNLDYYREGNIPEALIGVPETWTPEQIKEFQDQFDSMLTGVLAVRRRIRFMPEAKTILTAKDATIALKDETDEWLARLVCYAFSVPPIALVKMVNRQAGQQIAETAKEEGLLPFLHWMERRINTLLRDHLGIDTVQFRWKLDEEIDPRIAAEIRQGDVKAGIISVDEAREALGREVRGVDELLVFTAAGPVPLKETVDAARAKAKHDEANPQSAGPGFKLGPDGKPMPPEPEEPGAPGAKPAAKPKAVEKSAEAHEVHVHLGDTHVRVPPPQSPDLHFDISALDGVPSARILKKTVRAHRDEKTGELVGEITEHIEGIAKGAP